MARLPANARQTAEPTTEYFIYDKAARNLGPHDLEKDEDGKVVQTKIRLATSEAAFFLASGTIGTEDPSKAKETAEKAGIAPQGGSAAGSKSTGSKPATA